MFLLLRAVSRWVRRLLVVVLAAAVVYLLITSVQVITAARAPRAPGAVAPASAIVVIASSSSHGQLSTDDFARCAQAASLYVAKRAHRVIATSGPAASGARSSGTLVATCMEHRGVPAHAIELVSASTVPGQLAQAAGRVAPGADGKRRVILVADPLETRWLAGVAASAHLVESPSPAPAPKGSFWHTIGQVWAQTVAVGYGRIFGFGGTGWVKG